MKKNIEVISDLRDFLDNSLKEHGIIVLEIKESVKEISFVDITIYKKDDSTVSTDDCKIANRSAEEFLDKDKRFPDEYRLQVSSPGLDRVLKNDSDWKYALEKEVSIQMDPKKGEQKIYIGFLESFDKQQVFLKKVKKADTLGKKNKKMKKNKEYEVIEEEKIELKRNAIKKARLYFDWGGKNNG